MFESKIPKKIFKKNIKSPKEVELNLNDKEKIEVINFKKQEIRLKNEEVRLKSEEADLKKLNVLEKTFELDVWENARKDDKDYTNLMKIMTIRDVLESCVVDEDTSFGSEMKWKSPFEGNEIKTIKTKLFDLIDKM